MTKRCTTGQRSNNGGADLRPIRLVLEPLEARRLLAGVDFANTTGLPSIPSLNSTSGDLAARQQSTALQQPLVIQQFDLPAEGELAETNYAIAEDAPPGTLVGIIDVVDPIYDGNYSFDISDPRFSVQGNQLFFTSGKLDFETEPQIDFTITVANRAYNFLAAIDVCVTVNDVNERGSAIELSGGKVPEHEPGAVVGDLTVVDPDSQDNYAIYIFDSRFVLSGRQLRLADGIELDFETEPEVMLAVAATDGTFEIFDTVRIEVLPSLETPIPVSSIALDPRKLSELTAGAQVGLATVVNPKDSSYQFSVSDSRFEMRGNQLKLRDDQQVNVLVETEISLTLTAVGDEGDQATGTFIISVSNVRSPYHNHNLNEDVNGDGYVSPIDALLIINDLNTNGAHPVPSGIGGTGEPPSEMLDVNGDGLITPLDVLLIINHLNNRTTARAPFESTSISTPGIVPQSDSNPGADDLSSPPIVVASTIDGVGIHDAGFATFDKNESKKTLVEPSALASTRGSGSLAVFELAEARRQRENASIDAELEALLDQLSREQASSLGS